MSNGHLARRDLGDMNPSRLTELLAVLYPGRYLFGRLVLSLLLISASVALFVDAGQLPASTEDVVFVGASGNVDYNASAKSVNVYLTYRGGYSPWGVLRKPTEMEVQIVGLDVNNRSIPVQTLDAELLPSTLIAPDCNVSVSEDRFGDSVVRVHPKRQRDDDRCSLSVTYRLADADPRGKVEIFSFIPTEQVNVFVFTDSNYYACRMQTCALPNQEHLYSEQVPEESVPSYRTNNIYVPVYAANDEIMYGYYGISYDEPWSRDDWPRLEDRGSRAGTIVSRSGPGFVRINLLYGTGHLFILYQNLALIVLTLGIERFSRYFYRYLTSLDGTRA